MSAWNVATVTQTRAAVGLVVRPGWCGREGVPGGGSSEPGCWCRPARADLARVAGVGKL